LNIPGTSVGHNSSGAYLIYEKGFGQDVSVEQIRALQSQGVFSVRKEHPIIRGGFNHSMTHKINRNKQNRHIKGVQGYIEGRSILLVSPEMLLSLYSGKGTKINSKNGSDPRERFTHTEVIGIWKSGDGISSAETRRGVIHYSKMGAHIVPARPENHKEKR
jgi:hypothetical protein